MLKSEFYIGGFDRGGFQFDLFKVTTFNGFNPKSVVYRAEVVKTFGDVLFSVVYKSKRSALSFLDRCEKRLVLEGQISDDDLRLGGFRDE